MTRWVVAAGCALLLGAGARGSGERAYPRVIMFHGANLQRPIYMTDPEENRAFFASLVPRPHSEALPPADSTQIQMAVFWDLQWSDYAADSARLATLLPSHAEQIGQLYRAPKLSELRVGLRPSPVAAFVGGATLSRAYSLTAATVEILARHKLVAPGSWSR